MVNDSSGLRYLGYLLYCKSKPPLSSRQFEAGIDIIRTHEWLVSGKSFSPCGLGVLLLFYCGGCGGPNSIDEAVT